MRTFAGLAEHRRAEQKMEEGPYPVMRTVPTAIVVERLDCR